MVKKVTAAKTIRVKVAEELLTGMDHLVQEGWFPSREYILEKALKKFLNSNRPELLERFFREDVEWGLRGGK
jgi:hypothetical protein